VKYNSVLGLGSATPRDYDSFLNWVLINKPLAKPYYDFIWHIEDFVSVTGQSGGRAKNLTFFEDIFEAYVKRYPQSLLKV
jgi:hypothetical protein